MKVTIALLILGLLFATSCTYEDQSARNQVISEPRQLVFEVSDDGDSTNWREDSKNRRNELNKVRSLYETKEEDEEFDRKSELRNVRRSIDGEVVIGYNQKLDNPDFHFKYDLPVEDRSSYYKDYAKTNDNGMQVYFVKG